MMRKCRLNRPSRPFSRLAPVPPLKPSLLALALALALALGLAACGGGSKLLSGTTADEINANLEKVRELVPNGDCAEAEETVAQVNEQVTDLQGIDERLKTALEEGVEQLEAVVANCEEEPEEGETEPAEELEEPEGEEEEGRPGKAEAGGEEEEEKSEKEGAEKETAPPGQEKKEEEEAAPPAEESESSSGGVGPSTPAGSEG
jgi:TolA-binding protein